MKIGSDCLKKGMELIMLKLIFEHTKGACNWWKK